MAKGAAGAKGKGAKRQALAFGDRLVLNQWLISLFGVDPLVEHEARGRAVRPFHRLVDRLRQTREGLGPDGRHHFFHELLEGDFFRMGAAAVTADELRRYEDNVVSHTAAVNERRPPDRQIRWKYFQWLVLIFVEAYLDRYFSDRAKLLSDLNAFVERFNARYDAYAPVSPYAIDDLNKVCLQNATGSGKTLLLHVNLRQFRRYAERHGKWDAINFPFLLTPNARLSEQHRNELEQSGIHGEPYAKGANGGGRFGDHVYTLEIQKIQKEDGPETFAVRSFGDNNLLFVDEGHAGLSGKDDATWMTYRARLCEKGFSFEYSATFAQAVAGTAHEEEYAKAVLFDYSYRWFYEDGYGKDYQIYNLPKSYDEVQFTYLTACLLKYYQQVRIYEEGGAAFRAFNVEKPLWVFVGSTVTGGRKDRKTGSVALDGEGRVTATDVAQIVAFIGRFLRDGALAEATIGKLLLKTGAETWMLDADGNDFLHGAFEYLAKRMREGGERAGDVYRDVLRRVFHGTSSGKLQVERLAGASGEILLRAPLAGEREAFGLINVGAAKELCDHMKALPGLADLVAFTEDGSGDGGNVFQTVRESSSPVNLLIGSKKFVEGWDCWRVSTLGLMHVGKSEGAQIIQLFGRGVRLKGWEWSLKRSGHAGLSVRVPPFIHELELLNVFGIEADFMQRFRDYLRKEGLPGNERRRYEKIPLNVTYAFDKRLKVLRPKRKRADWREYDFRRDAPVPSLADEVPDYFVKNKVTCDWYPRVQGVASRDGAERVVEKNRATLGPEQIAMLDVVALCRAVERFRRERGWHNLTVTEAGVRNVLARRDWYDLYVPETVMRPADFAGVRLLQDVVAELLRRYAEKLYEHARRTFIEPRLEYRELMPEDANLPEGGDEYVVAVDADDETILNHVQQLKRELADRRKDGEVVSVGEMEGLNFARHLYSPLLHVRHGRAIAIQPVALNESEFRFIRDLCGYAKRHKAEFDGKGRELYLLRNQSRGRGIGFAEASNFHPDFILWMLEGTRQYVTFVDPHGLKHESPDSDKIMFAERVKRIEERLGDPDVVLNSFIVSPTPYQEVVWLAKPLGDLLERRHVLFMEDGGEAYLSKLFKEIGR